jgi:hypothetical protein
MRIDPCLDLFHARFYDPVGKKLIPVMAENAQALRYGRVKEIRSTVRIDDRNKQHVVQRPSRKVKRNAVRVLQVRKYHAINVSERFRGMKRVSSKKSARSYQIAVSFAHSGKITACEEQQI